MIQKTVLITGATSGIGRISAEKFAEKGLIVLIHGRSTEKIETAIDEIKKQTGNPQVFGYKADVSDLAAVKQLAADIKKDYQSLDIFINNAGLGPNHKNIFAVNYLATVVLCLELEPLLKMSKGRIVNIASEAQSPVDLHNFMSASGFEAYAQSKLAVIQFSFLLSERLKASGIKVNALDPGSFLATKMVKESWGTEGRDIFIGVNAHIKLALAPELEETTGQFFCEGQPAKAHPDAYNTALQNKLWEQTQQHI